MKRPLRSGITMFEVLVVLALIGFALGLLLPAIARLRQAASRAQSQNNLKQIGLAVHNYHDTRNRLPSGCDGKHFSAAAHLLPFIEQENLFRRIDFTRDVTDNANAAARATLIPTFLSPNDPQPGMVNGTAGTNYLFSAGSKPALKDNDGVFFLESQVRFPGGIPDGLSNTLLAVETLRGDGGMKPVDVKRQHVALNKEALKGLKDEAGVKDWKDGKHVAGTRCTVWADGRFLQGTWTATRGYNDVRPDVDCGGAGGLSALRGQEGGTNIGLCDGSVRFVRSNIPLNVLKLLAAAADGQPIPDF
jgi:type II secretory pathway pseudopilin PulG